MKYTGIFRSPLMGESWAPIRIAGPGSCELTPDGLRVSGHECARQSLPLVWFGLLALGVVASLLIYRAAANVALAILPTPVLIAIGVIGLMGLLSPLLKGGSEHRADRPVDILVPWASIGLVVRDDRQPGGVVMEVRNFEPKGGLHFRPDAGEAAFTTALNEARRGN